MVVVSPYNAIGNRFVSLEPPKLINELEESMCATVYAVGLILGANFLIYPLLAIPDAVLVGTNNGYKSISVQTISMVLSNCAMV